MEIIIGLVVIFVVISIIQSVFSWLVDLVGGTINFVIIAAIIAVFAIAYFAFSWVGVFCVIAIALLGFGILMVSAMLDEHDKRAKEVAKEQHEMQSEKIIHSNDSALMKELETGCMYLGYMDEKKWGEKLPNFRNRQYSTSFQEITSNFAKQVEFQYIWQDNAWFEAYKRYVLEHPAGSTVTKMLAEVDCPALKMTHTVEDGDLINTMLQRGTIRKSKDVPPLFNATFIEDANEWLYTPTAYLQRLYSNETSVTEKHTEEINFDDL